VGEGVNGRGAAAGRGGRGGRGGVVDVRKESEQQ